MKFVKRKIVDDENIGTDYLKNTREEKGIRIEEAASETGIKKEYLKALEEKKYDLLPKGPYKKTFLKKYCQFLDIDPKKAEREIKNKANAEGEKYSFATKNIKKKDFIVFPKIIRNVLVGILISIFFVYLGVYLKEALSPPDVKIFQPEDNLITQKRSIKIKGRTEAKMPVSINGEQVLNNEKGYFEKNIDLKKGVNIIKISAKKKYGSQKVITRQILVQ